METDRLRQIANNKTRCTQRPAKPMQPSSGGWLADMKRIPTVSAIYSRKCTWTYGKA